jgi:hypothetical protein
MHSPWTQNHPKAAPFRKKAFPLFDDIAEICEDVVAMGTNTFRTTMTVSSEDLSVIDPVLLHESEPSTSVGPSRGVSDDEDQQRKNESSDSVRTTSKPSTGNSI